MLIFYDGEIIHRGSSAVPLSRFALCRGGLRRSFPPVSQHRGMLQRHCKRVDLHSGNEHQAEWGRYVEAPGSNRGEIRTGVCAWGLKMRVAFTGWPKCFEVAVINSTSMHFLQSKRLPEC